jgi:predicted nucleotide-binding protein
MRLQAAVDEVAEAWSGSNLGYQAEVYYKDFQPLPKDAYFDPEWGPSSAFSTSSGSWRRYSRHTVEMEIIRRASPIDIERIRQAAAESRDDFRWSVHELRSLIAHSVSSNPNFGPRFFDQIENDMAKMLPVTASDALKSILPANIANTRDSMAILQGIKPAPHQLIDAELLSFRAIFAACRDLARLADIVSAHVTPGSFVEIEERPMGNSVFIGHGHSPDWRELKDFVTDRLKLNVEEFNRRPSAGIATSSHLTGMLDRSNMALLVMTAEDEQADGTQRARQNVIHEAGLFQGRLGFTRAIILLEDGCEEFSNVHGVGQLRFPKGSISAKFEEVRAIMEREGLL